MDAVPKLFGTKGDLLGMKDFLVDNPDLNGDGNFDDPYNLASVKNQMDALSKAVTDSTWGNVPSTSPFVNGRSVWPIGSKIEDCSSARNDYAFSSLSSSNTDSKPAPSGAAHITPTCTLTRGGK